MWNNLQGKGPKQSETFSTITKPRLGIRTALFNSKQVQGVITPILCLRKKGDIVLKIVYYEVLSYFLKFFWIIISCTHLLSTYWLPIRYSYIDMSSNVLNISS